MGADDKLAELLKRREALAEETKVQKKDLQSAIRKRKLQLEKQIRRAEVRISAAERKRRTRRLILMGSYMERITDNDPAAKDRLMKGLDGFLERDRDRALFGLPSRPKTASDGS